MIRAKICCIETVGEAALAVRHGADALGLVSEMPSGPGVISEDRIAEISAGLNRFSPEYGARFMALHRWLTRQPAGPQEAANGRPHGGNDDARRNP